MIRTVKKKLAHCEASIFKILNYFSDFSILAFNAANISLLSPKVAAGAFVDELDEVFSVAAFTFLFFFTEDSSEMQLLFEFFVEFDYFEISRILFFNFFPSFQGDE
jgi:hypothetical protein